MDIPIPTLPASSFSSIRTLSNASGSSITLLRYRICIRKGNNSASPGPQRLSESATSEQDESPLARNLHLNDVNPQAKLSPSGSRTHHRVRAHVQDSFPPLQDTSSPPTSPSVVTSFLGSMMPILPHEVTSIFDMSQRDLPPITPNAVAPLLDDAVDIPRSPNEMNYDIYHSLETSKASLHDRNQSFGFGQAVFHPIPKPWPLSNAPANEPSPGHNREFGRTISKTRTLRGLLEMSVEITWLEHREVGTVERGGDASSRLP